MPVGEEALLEGEQVSTIAVLVPQRVAAKAAVASQKELPFAVELVGIVDAERGEEQMLPEVAPVVASPRPEQDVFGALASPAAGTRGDDSRHRR
ncbi:MAG: hypothetical protein GY856_41445 [bacterium]|nr:hypothetical protein [bacterium]